MVTSSGGQAARDMRATGNDIWRIGAGHVPLGEDGGNQEAAELARQKTHLRSKITSAKTELIERLSRINRNQHSGEGTSGAQDLIDKLAMLDDLEGAISSASSLKALDDVSADVAAKIRDARLSGMMTELAASGERSQRVGDVMEGINTEILREASMAQLSRLQPEHYARMSPAELHAVGERIKQHAVALTAESDKTYDDYKKRAEAKGVDISGLSAYRDQARKKQGSLTPDDDEYYEEGLKGALANRSIGKAVGATSEEQARDEARIQAWRDMMTQRAMKKAAETAHAEAAAKGVAADPKDVAARVEAARKAETENIDRIQAEGERVTAELQAEGKLTGIKSASAPIVQLVEATTTKRDNITLAAQTANEELEDFDESSLDAGASKEVTTGHKAAGLSADVKAMAAAATPKTKVDNPKEANNELKTAAVQKQPGSDTPVKGG